MIHFGPSKQHSKMALATSTMIMMNVQILYNYIVHVYYNSVYPSFQSSCLQRITVLHHPFNKGPGMKTTSPPEGTYPVPLTRLGRHGAPRIRCGVPKGAKPLRRQRDSFLAVIYGKWIEESQLLTAGIIKCLTYIYIIRIYKLHNHN